MPEPLWVWALEQDLLLSSLSPLLYLDLQWLLRSALGDLLLAGYVLMMVLLLQAGVISLCLGGEQLGEIVRLEVLAEDEDEGMWKQRINQPRVNKASIWLSLTLFEPDGKRGSEYVKIVKN